MVESDMEPTEERMNAKQKKNIIRSARKPPGDRMRSMMEARKEKGSEPEELS